MKIILIVFSLIFVVCHARTPLLNETNSTDINPLTDTSHAQEFVTRMRFPRESCQSGTIENNTGKGAVGGAIAGAIVGLWTGLIPGAIAGAAIGAATGAGLSATASAVACY